MEEVPPQGSRNGAHTNQRVEGNAFMNGKNDPARSTRQGGTPRKCSSSMRRRGAAKKQDVVGKGMPQRGKVRVLESIEVSLNNKEEQRADCRRQMLELINISPCILGIPQKGVGTPGCRCQRGGGARTGRQGYTLHPRSRGCRWPCHAWFPGVQQWGRQVNGPGRGEVDDRRRSGRQRVGQLSSEGRRGGKD